MNSRQSIRAPLLGLSCLILNGCCLLGCGQAEPTEPSQARGPLEPETPRSTTEPLGAGPAGSSFDAQSAVSSDAPLRVDAARIAADLKPGDEPFHGFWSATTEGDGELSASWFFLSIEEQPARNPEPLAPTAEESAAPGDSAPKLNLPRCSPRRRPATE